MDTQKYTPEERMQIIMDALVNGATVGDVYHVSDQDKENALNAFTGATCLGDAENPTHQAYKQKANAMIELLQDEKA